MASVIDLPVLRSQRNRLLARPRKRTLQFPLPVCAGTSFREHHMWPAQYASRRNPTQCPRQLERRYLDRALPDPYRDHLARIHHFSCCVFSFHCVDGITPAASSGKIDASLLRNPHARRIPRHRVDADFVRQRVIKRVAGVRNRGMNINPAMVPVALKEVSVERQRSPLPFHIAYHTALRFPVTPPTLAVILNVDPGCQLRTGSPCSSSDASWSFTIDEPVRLAQMQKLVRIVECGRDAIARISPVCGSMATIAPTFPSSAPLDRPLNIQVDGQLQVLPQDTAAPVRTARLPLPCEFTTTLRDPSLLRRIASIRCLDPRLAHHIARAQYVSYFGDCKSAYSSSPHLHTRSGALQNRLSDTAAAAHPASPTPAAPCDAPR